MEYKLKIYEVIIKDNNSSEEYFIHTVRSAKDIYEDIAGSEREALENRVYDISDFIANL
jgi:hypothetical protein